MSLQFGLVYLTSVDLSRFLLGPARSTTAIVRGCVKEGPAKTKMMKTGEVGFIMQKWEAGAQKGSAGDW